MINLFKKPQNTKKVIFIVGTGRSGTHLVGRSLSSPPEIDANIEDTKYFDVFTKLATRDLKDFNLEDLKKLIFKYKRFLMKSSKNIILEKTHPNLWFVEELSDNFNNACFVAVRRGKYATVASMLKHKGVLSWYDTLEQNEVNKFLGITKNNLSYFKDLPLESKCALRWKSHNEEISRLQKLDLENLVIVDYEKIYEGNFDFQNKVNAILGEDLLFKIEELKKDSLDKWQSQLTDEQVENIDKVT